MLLRYGTIVVSMAMVSMVFSVTACSQTIGRKVKRMNTQSSHPFSVPGPGRQSALPAKTAASGKVAWSVEFGRAATPEWPGEVLIWGERLVVATDSHAVIFDRQGKQLGALVKQAGTPVAIGNDRLYYKSKQMFLEALGPSQEKVLAESSFPGAMDGDVQVLLFWPREKDFLAVLLDIGELGMADGDPPDKVLQEASVRALVANYGSTYGDTLFKFQGSPGLPPLLDPERQMLTLHNGEAVVVNTASRQVSARFAIPLERLLDWSVNAEGVYCVTGYAEDKKALVCLSPEGKELWRWTDTEDSDRWVKGQAPLQGQGKRVYALSEGRVLALEDGKVAWQFNARDAVLKHGARLEDGSFEIKDGRLIGKGGVRRATVLSDGSLLVTGNRTLRHLDANGREVFAVSLEEDILSQPIIDGEGHIYVTTATKLVRID